MSWFSKMWGWFTGWYVAAKPSPNNKIHPPRYQLNAVNKHQTEDHDHHILRHNARHMVANRPYVQWALKIRRALIKGSGIYPTFAGEFADVARRTWETWSSNPRLDYDTRMNWKALCSVIVRSILEDGGAFLIKEPANSSDRLPVNLRLRVLSLDHLVRIERSRGRPTAFVFRSLAANANASAMVTLDPESVSYIFAQQRAGEWFSPPTLQILTIPAGNQEQYKLATMDSAKVAGAMAAFITGSDGNNLGLEGLDEEDQKVDEKYEPVAKIPSGAIVKLPPGQDLKLATPPDRSAQLANFDQSLLREQAAGAEIPYTALGVDFADVNYSSARMERVMPSHTANEVFEEVLDPHLCRRVWEWFADAAEAFGLWPENRRPSVKWSVSPTPALDPETEIKVAKEKRRAGVWSAEDMMRAAHGVGSTFAEKAAEIAAENELMDRLGVVTDADPRKTSLGGQAQQNFSDADADE